MRLAGLAELVRNGSLALALVMAGGSFTGCDDDEPGPGGGDASVTDAAKDTALTPDTATSEANPGDGGSDATTTDAATTDGATSDAPASDAPATDAGATDTATTDTATADAATDATTD
jgi:hypothetical protein